MEALTTILTIIALIIVTITVNTNLSEQIGLELAIFNTSILIFLEMAGMVLGIVLLAAFIPVKRVSIMKPIDAIKSN